MLGAELHSYFGFGKVTDRLHIGNGGCRWG